MTEEQNRLLASLPKKYPVGWRFVPTDEELVNHYLMNKVLHKPLPAHVANEIEAADLYSKPPWDLVQYECESSEEEEEEWFFYVHRNDEDEHVGKNTIRMNDQNEDYIEGFWKLEGNDEHILNSDGQVVASKNRLTYFKLNSKKEHKKTNWMMEEYRLSFGLDNKLDFKVDNWTVGRIKRRVRHGKGS